MNRTRIRYSLQKKYSNLNFFSNPNSSASTAWIALTQFTQIDEISKASFGQTGCQAVAVFKHSSRCYISRTALKNMQLDWNWSASELPVYLLDLLQYPELSQALTSQYHVVHESPQLLLISNGSCIYNKSHGDISSEGVRQFIDGLKNK
jgi:bacillithiol system protein YtxJ